MLDLRVMFKRRKAALHNLKLVVKVWDMTYSVEALQKSSCQSVVLP
jgi:hypothetical protein